MKRKLNAREYKEIGIVMFRAVVVVIGMIGFIIIIADIIAKHFIHISLLNG